MARAYGGIVFNMHPLTGVGDTKGKDPNNQ